MDTHTDNKLQLPKRMKAIPTPFQNLGVVSLLPPNADLSPTSTFPPTPLDLFTTILPLTPPDATKSPRYVKELWDDFDHFGASLRTYLPPPPLPPSPVPADDAKPAPALPRLGVWRSNSTSVAKRADSVVVQALPPPSSPPAMQSATIPSPIGLYVPSAPPLKKKRRRHPRGAYRCRKCGGAKRAHDCPFACRQKSMATQTSLEITGGRGWMPYLMLKNKER